MKCSIKDFFSKCDQIRSFLPILWYLLKKYLMENFIFCAVSVKRIISKVSLPQISRFIYKSNQVLYTNYTQYKSSEPSASLKRNILHWIIIIELCKDWQVLAFLGLSGEAIYRFSAEIISLENSKKNILGEVRILNRGEHLQWCFFTKIVNGF